MCRKPKAGYIYVSEFSDTSDTFFAEKFSKSFLRKSKNKKSINFSDFF